MTKHCQSDRVKGYHDYIESGITVSLPDRQHFRFENLRTYKQLSGQGLKEMDFCWVVQTGKKGRGEVKKTVYLMEIWSNPFVDKAVDSLIGKVVDSLLMLASFWLPNSLMREDVPGEFHTSPDSIELFVVLKRTSSETAPFEFLKGFKDQLNGQLKSRLRLFNIEEVMVLYANDRPTIEKLGLENYLPEK